MRNCFLITFHLGFFLFANLVVNTALAQIPPRGQVQLKGELDSIPMHYIDVPRTQHSDAGIVLDGKVDEAGWQSVPVHDNMLMSNPATGEQATHRTDIRMLATERGLFVSAVMFQPPETLVRRLTNRDVFIDRENFGITLDVTGQGKFAYWFIVALGDSLMDGKVLPERRYSNDWDGPWIARTSAGDFGWSAEMYFPWSMLVLPDSPPQREIGFAFSRIVSYANERYQWPGHSQSSPQFVTALNTFRVSDVQSRSETALIPYITVTGDRARDDDEARVGADFVWRPSPAAAITLALNPDFGAVEADDVVVNLTALETFFPEKRLFFLEGNEVFEANNRASFGNAMRIYNSESFGTASRRVFVTDFSPPPISLLNTRRIGGTATQATLPSDFEAERGETNRPTDLLGAAKITGTIGDFRYGVMSAFEDDVEWYVRDLNDRRRTFRDTGRDFTVVRGLYETGDESRYGVGYLATHMSGPLFDATVHSLDAHYSSEGGRITADLQMFRSDVDGTQGDGILMDLGYRPNSNNRHTVRLDYLDESVDVNDLGFLARNDYISGQYIYTYVQPRGFGSVKDNRGAITFDQRYSKREGKVVDSAIIWRNTSLWGGRNTVRTALAYFPERFEDTDSRGNGAYRVEERIWWDVLWATDASKVVSFSAGLGGFQENLGGWTYQAKVGVTYRPIDVLTAAFDVTYRRRDGWVVYQGENNFGAYHGTEWQPKIDISWFVASNHQLRLSMQWAGVKADERGFFEVPVGDGDLVAATRTLPDHDFDLSIITAQLRYRWEIAPLTDLFVVYNRGSLARGRSTPAFSDLFADAFDDPVIDSVVVKLRYRFAN
ncbi:MAG: DUF5916 domain-containing protein [Pseudomonadota bacterium]